MYWCAGRALPCRARPPPGRRVDAPGDTPAWAPINSDLTASDSVTVPVRKAVAAAQVRAGSVPASGSAAPPLCPGPQAAPARAFPRRRRRHLPPPLRRRFRVRPAAGLNCVHREYRGPRRPRARTCRCRARCNPAEVKLAGRCEALAHCGRVTAPRAGWATVTIMMGGRGAPAPLPRRRRGAPGDFSHYDL